MVDSNFPWRATSSSIGGVPFAAYASQRCAVDDIVQAAACGVGTSVRFVNAYSVSVSGSDERYCELLRNSGLNMVDGTPISIGLRFRFKQGCRVRGPSTFVDVVDRGREVGLRHFLMGTDEVTLVALAKELKRRYEGALIVGHWAPPFAPISPEFVDEACRRVSDVHPDVVWVAVGAPKQDFLSTVVAQRTGVLSIGVGAAFDFVAGTVREAPIWVQRSGVEWIFRFCQDPKRLWKRYTVGNLRFLAAVGRNWKLDSHELSTYSGER